MATLELRPRQATGSSPTPSATLTQPLPTRPSKWSRARRVSTAVALVLVAILGFAGPASADSPVVISRDGGKFNGAVGWYHYPNQHGAMRIYGTLTDNKCDGHSVYLKVAVDNTSFLELLRLRGGCGTSAKTDTAIYNPNVSGDTTSGRIQVCIDLSALPDPCTEFTVHR